MKLLIRACLVALLAAVATSASAALEPIYQRMVELRAVLDAVQPLLDEFGEVTALEFITPDLYEVRSDRCRVAAHIVDVALEAGFVGPRQFVVTLDKIVCTAP